MESFLKLMPGSELAEVIEAYPWFGAARVELCKRQARRGEGRFADAVLYAGSRKKLFAMANESCEEDFRDSDISDLVRNAQKRKIRVVGGDFFSQEEYDVVRNDSDAIVPKFKSLESAPSKEPDSSDMFMNICTETLAAIYAEQGYYDEAKYIYSKLILRYPEKNAYFAALIEKLDQIAKN